MKIAQIAPLYESVPPKLYGGTERIVSYLTEALVNQGHEVTLFASGDSQTKATLRAARPAATRLDAACLDQMAPYVLLMEDVLKLKDDFDIFHFHIDNIHFPFCRYLKLPNLTTMHGRLDLPDLIPLFQEYRDLPLVSISNAQRAPLRGVHWAGTVYHGLPTNLYRFSEKAGDYLAFLGRVSPEKGLQNAIEIARTVGMKLKIAAKVDAKDKDFFDQVIKPQLVGSQFEFIGEISEREKSDFLGGARAVLFPIQWPEPFGLVMIEAMACGTPLIVFNQGSVPEIVRDGVTGFVARNNAEAAEAVRKVDQISRAACRKEFEERFSATRMAEDYVAIYQKIVAANKRSSPLKEKLLVQQ